MNWKRTSLLPFPLKIPFPKFPCRRSFCEFWTLNLKTSKGRDNFLLQHETREMGKVVTRVVNQMVWTKKLHPYLIAFFQVERRLEGQRTILMNGDVILSNKTHPDSIPVQIKSRIKFNIIK
jgi:hypothetical protein